MSDKADLLKLKLVNALLSKDSTIQEIERLALSKKLHKENSTIAETISESQKIGDLSLIIALEKYVLEHTLEKYGNSQSMENSYKMAILELEIIQNHLDKVDNYHTYKPVDDAFQNPKNRKARLPIDEARQGFSSHIARLNNLDRSNLSDDEKALLDIRKSAMVLAHQLYREKQSATLLVSVARQKN